VSQGTLKRLRETNLIYNRDQNSKAYKNNDINIEERKEEAKEKQKLRRRVRQRIRGR
jgi:hypothetical protein